VSAYRSCTGVSVLSFNPAGMRNEFAGILTGELQIMIDHLGQLHHLVSVGVVAGHVNKAGGQTGSTGLHGLAKQGLPVSGSFLVAGRFSKPMTTARRGRCPTLNFTLADRDNLLA